MITYQQSEIDSVEFELRNDKAAIVDTDTVMGVISLNKKIIYKVKKRPHYKKLVIFIKDFDNIGVFTNKEVKVLKKYWPGKLTVIKNHVGYRVPNDKFLLNLLDKVGYLYSSSANISGKQPIKSLDEAQKVFKNTRYKLVFVNNQKQHNIDDQPSTIINLDTYTVVRKGNVDGEQILKEIR